MTAKLRVIALVLMIGVVNSSRGDDLDVMISGEASAAERGQAYERLLSADFDLIAPKLARLRGKYPMLTGWGPSTKEPWSERQLSEWDRIACTLRQLWEAHIEASADVEKNVGLMLDLLEKGPAELAIDAGVSPYVDGVIERMFASRFNDGQSLCVQVVKGRLMSDKEQLPAIGTIIERLDRIVRDEKRPAESRRLILRVCSEFGDPNAYLDLAIQLANAETTPSRRISVFLDFTPGENSRSLTEENRRKFVRHGYALLDEVNKHQPEYGYHLALRMEHFLGASTGETVRFVPDRKSKRYQTPTGLEKAYFEDTVKNALRWWDGNKARFQNS